MARQSEPSMGIPVLLTRPEAEAQAFASALTGRFGGRVRPVVAPLMVADFLKPPMPPGPFSGVIFTSATAVEAAARLGQGLPKVAWCVGRKTAARAAEAGFQARSSDGDATALVSAILVDPPPGRLLHLRGEDTRGEVEGRLNSAGTETESLVVYRQCPQPLPPEGTALLMTEGPVILPLFSPRSAALFAGEMPRDLRATLWLVAMSEAVADAARGLPRQVMELATAPNAGAMLEAVGRVLNRASLP